MPDIVITPATGKLEFVDITAQATRRHSFTLDPNDGVIFDAPFSASSVTAPLNIINVTVNNSNVNYPFVLAASGETGPKALLMDGAGGTYNPSTNTATIDISGNSATTTLASNSSQLNGQAASYYTNIPARLGYTPANKAGDTITGDFTVNGNFTLLGNANFFSASNIYITSSVVQIDDNIITLNAFSPYLRYAGIEMYDSGSGTLSSVLWDSQNDYFFLTGSGVNGKIITGPDSQADLSTNYIPKATGGYKLGNSLIQDNATTVTIGGTTVIDSSTPATVLRLKSAGSTIWSLGVTDAAGSYFNIGADFGNFTINKTNGLVSSSAFTANGTITAGSFTGAGTGLTGTASGLSIGGNAATVTGITNQNSGNTDLNTLTTSGFYRLGNAATNDPTPNKYGQLLVIRAASDTITQIVGDYATGILYTRSGNPSNVGGNGSYSSWRTLVDNANYTDYTVTKTGTGASGTWNITSSWATNAVTALNVGNGTITIAAGTGVGVGTTNTFTTNQSGNTTVTITNNGVTSNVAGTGISVSGATGAVTITNSGVTSLTGTANQVSVSAASGGVTLSLPQDIHTGAAPTFSFVTPTSGFIKSDNIIGLLTTAGAAQKLRTGGILVGQSYDAGPNNNEIRTTANTSLIINARGTGDLILQTADNQKAILLNNGNIGIGTTTPGAKLQVIAGNSTGISLFSNNGGQYAYQQIGRTSSELELGVVGGANQFFTGTVAGDAIIKQNSTGKIHLGYGSAAPSITIDSSNNVGIGTISPLARLQVNSPTAGATLLRADGTNGTLFSVVDDLSDSLMSVNNAAGLPVLEVFVDDRIVAGQYGQNDLVVRNNKVGVGTNNPSAKLHVTGSTGAIFEVDTAGNTTTLYVNSSGNVGVNTTDFSYTTSDNSRLVGSNTNNKLFVNGSIQLLGNNDAIVFGRGTATFLTDEELGFGWGGGWYMVDDTWVRVRNNKYIYGGSGVIRTDGEFQLGGSGAYFLANSTETKVASAVLRVITDSITAANAGTRGFILDGNYTNGQYRHRWRKYDDGSGVPLYIDYAHGTANSYTALARFGGGGTYNSFTVYGTQDITGNLGVGTTSPSTRLHIYENANRVTYIAQNNNHTARFEAYGTATAIDTTASNGIFFRINGGDIVKFAADGNVGIGTNTVTAKVESYFSSNAVTINYLATNLNNNSPIPVYGFDVTNGSGESRSIKAGIGYERHLTNGRGTLHFYNDSTNDTQSLSGNRTSAGDIKMSIDNDGNVGIGTPTPTYKLQVQGSFYVNSTAYINGALTVDDNIIVTAGNDFGIYDSDGTGAYWQYMDSGIAYLRIDDGGSANGKLNINNGLLYVGASGGNVGINTTGANSRLHIYDNSDVWHFRLGGASGELRMGGQNNSGAVIQAYTPAGAVRDLYLQRDGGAIGIGTNSPLANCLATFKSSNTGRVAITDGTTTANMWPTGGNFYISTETASDLVIITNVTERMRILSGGNVGIGTSNPGRKLDVEGIVRTRGASGTGGFEISAASSGTAKWRIEWDSASDSLDFNWVG